MTKSGNRLICHCYRCPSFLTLPLVFRRYLPSLRVAVAHLAKFMNLFVRNVIVGRGDDDAAIVGRRTDAGRRDAELEITVHALWRCRRRLSALEGS